MIFRWLGIFQLEMDVLLQYNGESLTQKTIFALNPEYQGFGIVL